MSVMAQEAMERIIFVLVLGNPVLQIREERATSFQRYP